MIINNLPLAIVKATWYVDESGFLRNKYTRASNCVEHALAGFKHGSGYIRVNYGETQYAAHRIIWMLYHDKEIPAGYEIDHENRIRDCNTKLNLRCVTLRQNHLNKDQPRGASGVYLDKRCNRYKAQSKVNGKTIHIGYYGTIEEAGNAVRKYEANLQ